MSDDVDRKWYHTFTFLARPTGKLATGSNGKKFWLGA